MIDEKDNGVISNYYKDLSTGRPIVKIKTEKQTVNSLKNVIQLMETPDEQERVTIVDGTDMVEVDNYEDLTKENQYWVDYSNGMGNIYFHPNKKAQTYNIEYGSKGYTLISAYKIFMDFNEESDLPTIVGELLKKNEEIIKDIFILGGGMQVIYKLQQSIADGNELHTNLQSDISTGQPLDESLKVEIPKAQVIEPKLKEQNVEANRILPLLTTQNEQAVVNHGHLQEDIANTGEIVDKIKTTGNASFIVEVNDWTTSDDPNWSYMYTLSTSLHSSDLVFKTQEITTKGFEDCLLYSIVKDANTIAFYTDNNIRTKIVVNARQYGGIIQDFSVVNTDLISEGASNKYVTLQEKVNIGTIPDKVDKEEGKGLSTNDYTDSDQSEVAKIKNLLNLTYPVGSIYMSVNNTNPKSLFGGTWEEFAKGKTLIGVDTTQTEFNTVEKTGGEKTHKLIIDEMPIHTPKWNGYSAGNLYTGSGSGVTYALFGSDTWRGSTSNGIQPVGGDQPHNNLQPYITCYMWKRTK